MEEKDIIEGGFILLSRQLLESKIWSCSDATFKVFVYLLLCANHKAKFFKMEKIKRGQTCKSLTTISEECNLSRKAVRHALKILQREKVISRDFPFGAQQGHRITICNYETYQNPKMYRGIEGNNEGNNEGANEGTTNNNEKNEKNEKKYNMSLFEECWTLYGKKGTKKTAIGYWKKLSENQRQEVREKIPEYVSSTPNLKFRKHFDGWINPQKQMWKNEVLSKNAFIPPEERKYGLFN